jgi:C-terminal processing protease CtpA/Prc
MSTFIKLAASALLLVSALVQAAPEAPLTPQQRNQVIADIASAFEQTYIFPEVGSAIARDLLARRARGEYDHVSASRDLAALLSRHIDDISHDKHTEVAYLEEDQLAAPPPADPATVRKRAASRRARAKAANYGFAAPQRLDGNIALVRFDSFYPPAEAAPFVHALMSDLADADALILDLRENGGGAAQLIPVLASYLFDEQPVHLYDTLDRRLGTRSEAWTAPALTGARFGGRKPVYILTSAGTISAAENLAYTLQKLGRATVVGERTVGAAHGSYGKPVSSHLVPMVASRRIIHAVTKSDWDRSGVLPDIKAPAGEALDVALARARADLAKSAP